MKRIRLIARKIAIGVAALLGAVAALLAIVVLFRGNRRFEAPYPALSARSDPALVARGRYLVYGPAHCSTCHGDPALLGPEDESGFVPLTGGKLLDTPLAAFYAPNLTPDPETGIGRFRDEELARSLRHGVGTDGRALMPFMPFQTMSDEDVVAVLSFLRSQTPVRRPVPAHHWKVLGRVIKALLLEPMGPREPPPRAVEASVTPEYGRYLAYSVTNCYGCHTQRNMRTGAFVGAPFAGGLRFEARRRKGVFLVSPNLTPDIKTGRIATWSEDVFVARFKLGGATVPGTHMPWWSFHNMTEDDLRALYRFFQSLGPVANATEAPALASESPP